MADPMGGSTPPPGGEGGGGQADGTIQGGQPSPGGSSAQPTGVAPVQGQPPGDPLADYRDVFQATPGLQQEFVRAFGSEHAAGAELTTAHDYFEQVMTERGRRLLKGAGNHPEVIAELAYLQRDRAGLVQENTALRQENTQLRAQIAGKPLRYDFGTGQVQPPSASSSAADLPGPAGTNIEAQIERLAVELLQMPPHTAQYKEKEQQRLALIKLVSETQVKGSRMRPQTRMQYGR